MQISRCNQPFQNRKTCPINASRIIRVEFCQLNDSRPELKYIVFNILIYSHHSYKNISSFYYGMLTKRDSIKKGSFSRSININYYIYIFSLFHILLNYLSILAIYLLLCSQNSSKKEINHLDRGNILHMNVLT